MVEHSKSNTNTSPPFPVIHRFGIARDGHDRGGVLQLPLPSFDGLSRVTTPTSGKLPAVPKGHARLKSELQMKLLQDKLC